MNCKSRTYLTGIVSSLSILTVLPIPVPSVPSTFEVCVTLLMSVEMPSLSTPMKYTKNVLPCDTLRGAFAASLPAGSFLRSSSISAPVFSAHSSLSIKDL